MGLPSDFVGKELLLLRCEALCEERSAGNPHATFCGSRRRATASGDPVERGNPFPYRDLSRHVSMSVPDRFCDTVTPSEAARSALEWPQDLNDQIWDTE